MRRWHLGLVIGSLAIAAIVLAYAAQQSANMTQRTSDASAESEATTSARIAAEKRSHHRYAVPARVKYKPAATQGFNSGDTQVQSTRTADAREAPPSESRPSLSDATELLGQLRNHGLPISGYVSYTAASDENHLLGRPGMYISKVNFKDARIPAEESLGDPTSIDAGGSIETFNNAADARRRFDYVSTITQSAQFAAEYDYLVGTILLRVSKVFTPSQASTYEKALPRAVG